MALSEQRARELSEIEPPPSLDRIVRFLEEFRPRLPLWQPLLGDSNRAKPAASRFNAVMGSGDDDPAELGILLARYQIGIAEITDFSLWLLRWNERRNATEVLTLAEFNRLNMPLAFLGKKERESQESGFDSSRKSPESRAVSSDSRRSNDFPQQTRFESARAASPESRKALETSLPLADSTSRRAILPGVAPIAGALAGATSLGAENAFASAAKGSAPTPKLAPSTQNSTGSSVSASTRAEAAATESGPAFVPRREIEPPDTMRRAWRAARESEEEEAPQTSKGAAKNRNQPVDSGPNARETGSLDTTTRQLAGPATLSVLQRTVWGANLTSYAAMAGFGAARSEVVLGQSAISPAAMGVAPTSLQGAVPVFDGGVLPLSRPAMPTVSYLGVAPPQPELATPSLPQTAWQNAAPTALETRPSWAETGLPAPAPQPETTRARDLMERRPVSTPAQLPLPAPFGEESTQFSAPDDAQEPERSSLSARENHGSNAAFAGVLSASDLPLPALPPLPAPGETPVGAPAQESRFSPPQNPVEAARAFANPAEAAPDSKKPTSMILPGLLAGSAALWMQTKLAHVQEIAAMPGENSPRGSRDSALPMTLGIAAPDSIGKSDNRDFQPGFPGAGLLQSRVFVENQKSNRGQNSVDSLLFSPRIWDVGGQMSPSQNEPGDGTNFPQNDTKTGEKRRLDPQFGALTIVAPPLRVASAEADASGAAVAFNWAQLAASAGELDAPGLERLRAVLPLGAQAIYPALKPGSEGPNGFTLRVASPLLRQLLQDGYGAPSAEMADELAAQSPGAASQSGASASIDARLVPGKRPPGRTASILPPSRDQKPATGAGALAQAGGGAAQRGGVLDFLGLPVRLAPSLGGKSELSDQVAVRGGASGAAADSTVRPQAFAPLREKLFGRVAGVSTEPDEAAWQQAAPDFGLRDARPTTLLAPDSRLKPLSAAAPRAQTGAARPADSPFNSLFSPASPAGGSGLGGGIAPFSPRIGAPAPSMAGAGILTASNLHFASGEAASNSFSRPGSGGFGNFGGFVGAPGNLTGHSNSAAPFSGSTPSLPQINPYSPTSNQAISGESYGATRPDRPFSPAFSPFPSGLANSTSTPNFTLAPSRVLMPAFSSGRNGISDNGWDAPATEDFGLPHAATANYLPQASPGAAATFSAPEIPDLPLGSLPSTSPARSTFSSAIQPSFSGDLPSVFSAPSVMSVAPRLASSPLVSGLAERAPAMLFPNPAGIADRRNPLTIQRSIGGSATPAKSASSGEKKSGAKPSGDSKGAAPQEVDLLAQEVWSLLKRRLDVEKQRMNFASRAA